MKKIFKEPLVHFLLIGAVLFVIFEFLNPTEQENQDTIYIGKDEIAYIKNHFFQRYNRNPTKLELNRQIDNYVSTEAYYREAIKLGLDKNDHTIKRHLQKKMQLMSKGVLSLLDISDEDLNTYMNKNRDKFTTQSMYAFEQVQIDPDKHKDNLKEYLLSVKEKLDNNIKVKSDSAIVPAHFSAISKKVLLSDFGKKFTDKLDKMNLHIWSGPLVSYLGIHYVKLEKRTKPQLAKLKDIRELVLKSYIKDKQKSLLEKQRKEFINKYHVEIDDKAYKNETN